MANQGNPVVAIPFLILFVIAGFFLTFNVIVPNFLLGGSIAFNSIRNLMQGFWIILLRIVIGPALMVIPTWVIVNIFKESL